MRLKGKGATSLLALRLGEPAGLVEEPAAGGVPTAVPYRLVPVAEAGPDPAAPPAVLVASNARVRSPKPVLALQQPDFSQLEQAEALVRLQQGATPAASSEQQPDAAAAAAAPAASAPTTASGRPQRKRKAPQYADDMIPTDVLSRRGGRSRPPAAAANPPRVTLSTAGGAAGGLQLVTMNTPGGGTVTGLAVPATALLPALLQQQQLLRAQGAASPGAVPYKLVPPGGAASPSSSSDAAAAAPPPAVKEAAPRDIAQLARQMDEEERKRALAAADARVVVRVLPGAQGSRGSKDGFAVPAPRPPGSRGKGSAAAGRGRAPSRLARKPTPDIADEQLPQLPPHTWHPGFESHGGVTVVSVAEAVTAPPLPAVVVGEPARTALPVLVTDPQAEFGEDPLHSSLDYLHYAARTAGQPPAYSTEAQTAVAAEERLHKERLARAHFARDRRKIGKEAPEATRKSVRIRAVPEVLAPPAVQAEARGRGKRLPPRPEDATDVNLGREFQADLPAVRPRPVAPTAEEQRFVSRLVCSAGDVAPLQYDVQQTAALPVASEADRAAAVAAAHEQLKAALGAERAAAMGVLSSGAAAFSQLLNDTEEAAFEAGMREFGRTFHTIRAEMLPERTVFDLQNYYFNVWKLQATPRAKAWYVEKAEEEVARAAEQARLEAAAAAEAEAARQRQEARYKRRMLREVVQFVKTAARAPEELQNRPTVAARAQRAAKMIGSMNAGEAAPPGPEAPAVEVPAATA
ncbi:hypothetical protein C2E21_1393 [Chlorella sorokiniana]|uniref:Uncharacterized protein n=1 Tax=Chlorella sorokiniana TaxID=3076 RepID=A0A2P6U066_CHLSO|nr:hypothetical protein C2E21_1393 [Chlorella sorokiniana]|eukprot:PRW59696.1 hypothetical protein C2E21_1393 [Chlorella sorokiniana]